MKNLLVITSGFPSKKVVASTFVKDLIDEFKDHFKNIFIISPEPYFPKSLSKFSFVPYDYRRASLYEDYSYDNVKVFYPRFFTLPLEACRRKNGDFAFKAALRVIKRHNLKFDLIHAHFTYPSGYAAVKLKGLFDVPVVLTTHGLHITRLDKLKKLNALYVWNNTNAIINVSKKCVELLKEQEISESKLWYVPNGVDLSKFYPMSKSTVQEKLGLFDDKKVIVSVGNLVKKKGHIHLIKAAKELLKIRNDFVIYIVGGGVLYNFLENTISNLKLHDYVKLVGAKPHEEIPLWMNLAEVFVLPSFVENFGVVNIEALACGTPVVSTINGGSEEIITSEDYGFLLDDPDDFKGLAELIDKALNKKWDKEKILSYAKNFTWQSVAKELLKVYKRLIV